LLWRIALLGLLAAVGLSFVPPERPQQTTNPANDRAAVPNDSEPPFPPFTESRFLNTHADARSIGTAACVGCHKAQHQSYLLTPHSRAMSDVDPSKEPPDGAFTHPASGRSYRVYRGDGGLRHEEVLAASDGTVIARVDLPLRYLIGSGEYARAYAVEVDGFLHESPLAWYAHLKKWDMSPGYDTANHGSFERPVMLECLACHAGRVEEVGGAINRLTVTEKAIGCENCHGPGSVHQEFHRSQKLAPGASDLTIVHPGKLPRPLQEAICSSCHLGEPAIVPVRGRQISDFRPGRPLSDYRTHYRTEGTSGSMTVVGHVDQLHESACYQKSPELTCLTCHDPHDKARPADRTALFRANCVSCHTTQPCKLPVERRLKTGPPDNCVSCHMPRSDTEVPHVAFTHHRIGVHGRAQPPAPQTAPELIPTDDLSGLSAPDRARNLGLAYQIVRRNPTFAAHANEYRERARVQLETAYAGGLRDAETVLGLAELAWRTDKTLAREYARQALAARDVSPKIRAMALMTLAYSDFQNNNDADAVTALEELTRVRRLADDWRILGLIHLRQGHPEQALGELKRALAIRPFRPAAHAALADAYERLGSARLAAEHREKARWLRQHNQD
jgi:hypothetical protein